MRSVAAPPAIGWLVLRRMRGPLVALILAYAVSVLGLAVIPGIEIDGARPPFSFLHATYIVSYTATTIGFGEIPYAFSDAQRLWMILVIHLSVITWLYSIGSILALLGDAGLREAFVENRFARRIARLREPFHLVCGYGETGSALVRALTSFYIRVVVLDIDPARINALTLDDQDYRIPVPGLRADATAARALRAAGLGQRHCLRVIANTGDDRANLQIAITARLLAPHAGVIARVQHQDVAASMAAFGTQHILDPFEIFVNTLALAWVEPAAYELQDWLLGLPGEPYRAPRPPPRGTWILCGFGRFGRRLHARLTAIGLPTVVIDPRTDIADPPPRLIVGTGTVAETLREAGIETAAGLVAGADDDVGNLAIIMTARQLNPRVFSVARQNEAANSALFDALGADLIMNPRQVLATRMQALITCPDLDAFVQSFIDREEAWAADLLARLRDSVGGDAVPDVWPLALDDRHAPALVRRLATATRPVTVGDLLRHACSGRRRLAAHVVMVEAGGQRTLDPDPGMPLAAGQRLLLCGDHAAWRLISAACHDDHALHRLLTGEDLPRSAVFRWLARQRATPSPAPSP